MRKTLSSAAGIISLGLLSGCAALAVATTAVPVLSEAATVACAGQQAANAAGDAAIQLGSASGAAAASAASKVLGLACTWL